MRRRAGFIARVGCLLSLAATIADAGVFAARVRWRPSASGGVVGYRVYQRTAGGRYGAGADVGLPAPGPDGTLSTIVAGLRDGTAYLFALTAYMADGSESAPSNELSLGGGTGPATDACADFAAPTPLRVRRFLLRPRRVRVLVARGSFPLAGDLDPTVAGATIEVYGPDGEVLFGAAVPPSAFEANRRHTRFRYARGAAPAGAEGLDRLVLRRAGAAARVLVAGSAPELVQAAREPRLGLVVRVGDQCARAESLVCRVTPARTACE